MAYSKPVFLWKQAPFTRLLPALVAGILTGYYADPSRLIIFSGFAAVTLALLILSVQKAARRYFMLPLSGFLWMLLIGFLGMLTTHFSDVRHHKNWYGNYINDIHFWKAKIISKPEEKEKSYKAIAEIITGYKEDSAIRVKGKVLLYLQKENDVSLLKQGDVLYFRNKLRRISPSGNPGSFDYRKYMEYHHVFYQAFLYKDDKSIATQNQISWINKWINTSLAYENNLFDRYVKGNQETALAKALITGDRADLDRDLVQAYSNAGVVHIMSISGLHIGLIYIFLFQLVKVIPPLSKNKFAKAIFVLSGIWFFTMLTGCSPSVMRSAVMFSCLHVGTLLNRKVPTYNFWSASAFLLLCFDPMLLWDVGFQLSYAAVLGILVAQRAIYSGIIFKNKIVDYCWQMISVSLAAQLFTLPACIYYFHQVPLLFIVANLVAIPLSSIGLWLSLILIMAGWMPLLPAWIGAIISYVYRWLNDFISYMDSLVFTVWSGIYLNLSETFLFLLAIIFITQWLLHKNTTALRASVITCTMLFLSFATGYWRTANQHRMIVYNVSSATAIDIISGRKYSEIFDGDDKNPSVKITLENSRRYYGVKTADTSHPGIPLGNNEFYPVRGNIMVVRSSPRTTKSLKDKIHLKAIILSNAHSIRISDLNNLFDAEMYIFSPLNKRYEIERWKKECEDLHLRSHDVATQGAIMMDF